MTAGMHSLTVTATDAAGNVSTPVAFAFETIIPPAAKKKICKTVKIKRHGKMVKKKKCKWVAVTIPA